MIFTCSSTSNTFPADHGLSFIFTWFIDSQANIASSRFLYSGKTLSISNVQKTDKNKYISCAAKENITEGLISETSKELRIDVYCKYEFQAHLQFMYLKPSSCSSILLVSYMWFSFISTLNCAVQQNGRNQNFLNVATFYCKLTVKVAIGHKL